MSAARTFLGGIILCVAASSAAHADVLGTIDLKFLSNSSGALGPQRLNAWIHYDDGTRQVNQHVGVGQMHFRVENTTGVASNFYSAGDRITTFCTDIFQLVRSDQTLTIRDLADAPEPYGAMGEFKAGLIRGLFETQYEAATSPFASPVTAAAFQATVWEIVNEDLDSSASDLTAAGFNLGGGDGGNFRIGFIDPNHQSNVLAMANSWLAGIWANQNSNFGVFAGTNATAQDQLLVLIPLPAPFAMGLAGLGLTGLAVRRARRA